MEAFEEGDWARKFADIAGQVASLGGSHRGGLEAVKLLPSNSERADILRAHAATILLSSLLQAKVHMYTLIE